MSKKSERAELKQRVADMERMVIDFGAQCSRDVEFWKGQAKGLTRIAEDAVRDAERYRKMLATVAAIGIAAGGKTIDKKPEDSDMLNRTMEMAMGAPNE